MMYGLSISCINFVNEFMNKFVWNMFFAKMFEIWVGVNSKVWVKNSETSKVAVKFLNWLQKSLQCHKPNHICIIIFVFLYISMLKIVRKQENFFFPLPSTCQAKKKNFYLRKQKKIFRWKINMKNKRRAKKYFLWELFHYPHLFPCSRQKKRWKRIFFRSFLDHWSNSFFKYL